MKRATKKPLTLGEVAQRAGEGKKLLILTFTLTLLLCTIFTLNTSAATVASGDCGAYGNNLTWVLDDTGTLTISGTGEMDNYPLSWYELNEDIDTVIITDNVTSIGELAFCECYNLKKVIIESDVTTIENSAFFMCIFLKDIVINKSVKTIGNSAFDGCYELSKVGYTGTENDWNQIDINAGNEELKDAKREYIRWITLVNYDTKIYAEKYYKADTSDLFEDINVGDEYNFELYREPEYINKFEEGMPIDGKITLYIKRIHKLIEKIEIEGISSAELGDCNIRKIIHFATNKNANYLICTLKYSDKLILKNVIAKDFKYVYQESEKNISGIKYLTLTCQYSDNINIPTNIDIKPFELFFDISTDAAIGSVSIEFTSETYLIGDTDYYFNEKKFDILEILPKFAEEIKIIGADSISGESVYTATVYPDYTTNKNVVWSVNDESVATISLDGKLTPLKGGIVILTATATDGSGVSGIKIVTVTIGVATITKLKSNIGTWNTEFLPEVRKYVIYVDEATESISLTASFTGGTLKMNNSVLMINNRARTINLTNDTTVITLDRSGVTGCENGSYTLTIIKSSFTKTVINEKDGETEFTVSGINIENGNYIILGIYNGNKLIDLQKEKYIGNDITFKSAYEYDTAKVMVWKDLATDEPEGEVEIIEK